MYIGHVRLYVCVHVSVAFQHYCTDPDVTWGNGMECPIVVHYWADLQSVHGFRCYDNIALLLDMHLGLEQCTKLDVSDTTAQFPHLQWRSRNGLLPCR